MSTVTANRPQIAYGPVLPSVPSWAGATDQCPVGVVDRAIREANRVWLSRSRYLTRARGSKGSRRSVPLAVPGAFAALAVVALSVAVIGSSASLLILAAGLALAAWGLFWRWVAANRDRSPTLWGLERARRCLAGAGDPGQRA